MKIIHSDVISYPIWLKFHTGVYEFIFYNISSVFSDIPNLLAAVLDFLILALTLMYLPVNAITPKPFEIMMPNVTESFHDPRRCPLANYWVMQQ